MPAFPDRDTGLDAGHDTGALRKARGAFYTPAPLARYVTDWAIRDPDDRVLEPACGQAAFLVAAGQRLAALGARPEAGQLVGSDVHAASAQVAARRLHEHGYDAELTVEDFLRRPPEPVFDAVVGNPPYVRYQAFVGQARAVAQAAALRAGVRLTNLASSWAAFTVHAALFVRPGGRLGLVLPAELLTVNYAAPVREFLMNAFARVRLVVFTERVFPDVLEDVVLVLAEGRGVGASEYCELVQARNAADLAGRRGADVTRWQPAGADRWSALHVDPAATAAYERALSQGAFTPLSTWGETTLGMVTGRNAFFALTGAEVARWRLSRQDVIRISPPGSRHLRALSLSPGRLAQLDAAGRATWLFRPAGEPSAAGRRYIRYGERHGVDTAYKCRVRRPWWRVPALPVADLLLTYMNADTARLCTNLAGVHHLNSVHGVYLRPGVRDLGRSQLSLASLNSVTLLGAELVGRAYGGGILKLEPGEADRWPMPTPDLVARRAPALQAVRDTVTALVGAGRLPEAVSVVDGVLFADGQGPGPADLAAIRQARAHLHARRVTRGRSRPTDADEPADGS